MNAFDTAHYIRLRQRMSAVFDPAFAGPLPEKREELGEGYAVQVRFYTAGAGKLPQYPYSVRASESRLLAPDGRELYTWSPARDSGRQRNNADCGRRAVLPWLGYSEGLCDNADDWF